MTLKEYRNKRPSGRSPEPRGRHSRKRGRKAPHFVIQHHAASTNHYDFRLEIDGALASWAVPKGPSTNPKDKRMARRTEDHPMKYEKFEGVIRTGEKGETWLLVKRRDQDADARRNPLRSQPESVLSGRTLDEVS
jgi:DNA ligase D-like protein (predicted 3'-phosphoesterase)